MAINVPSPHSQLWRWEIQQAIALLSGGMGSSFITYSDTAPTTPVNGQLWWETDSGILWAWYTDPDSSQWVQVAGPYTQQLKTARGRNRVINPTAQISQENSTTAITAIGYPADQWRFTFTGIVCSGQRTTLVTPTPEGTTTGVTTMATTAKASLAAGDFLQLMIPIEGLDFVDFLWGTANAKPAVLRFCAVADTPGTYGIAVSNDVPNRTWLGSFTITSAGVPQVFSLAIPGDTTGTWKTDSSMSAVIHFTQAAGSTSVGVAGWQAASVLAPPGCLNGAAVANTKLTITDVGLYKDTDNTGLPPPFEVPSYEDDLQRCMRYYENGGMLLFSGNVTSGATYYVYSPFKVPKRIAPSVTSVSQGGTSAFPAGFGTPAPSIGGVYESRAANATGMGLFHTSNFAANARLI